jgi:hypothetical protein
MEIWSAPKKFEVRFVESVPKKTTRREHIVTAGLFCFRQDFRNYSTNYRTTAPALETEQMTGKSPGWEAFIYIVTYQYTIGWEN